MPKKSFEENVLGALQRLETGQEGLRGNVVELQKGQEALRTGYDELRKGQEELRAGYDEDYRKGRKNYTVAFVASKYCKKKCATISYASQKA